MPNKLANPFKLNNMRKMEKVNGTSKSMTEKSETLRIALTNALRDASRHVIKMTYADAVAEPTTHSIGDGLWSIELHRYHNDPWGEVLAEFVGSNGTREPADDLWEEVKHWYATKGKEVYKTTVLYQTPDGCWLSFYRIMSDIENHNNLHGLTLRF